MSTASTVATRSPFISFTLADFWRTFRMWENLLFLIGLPLALYFMFGVAPKYGLEEAGNGNIRAYIMVSMAVYGAVMATTTVASMAGLERQQGWTRQLYLAGFSSPKYLFSKLLQSLVLAVVPTLTLFIAGAFTEASFDSARLWFQSAALILVCAVPFIFYGLCFSMWLRSESATSISSGLIVVFAFFGDLFTPLEGTLADIAPFTPMWGVATLARWPQMEGLDMAQSTPAELQYHDLWAVIANIIVWTVIFLLLAWAGSRRSRSQR